MGPYQIHTSLLKQVSVYIQIFVNLLLLIGVGGASLDGVKQLSLSVTNL